MRVDAYEKFWLWAAAIMIVGFLGAIVFAAAGHAIHPPSHIETIDPRTLRTDSEFARPGVFAPAAGEIEVVVLTEMFRFSPEIIRVPAGRPVRFRAASPDVIHGFQVVGTNANFMVIPGYVSQATITFPHPGEYLIVCNEYCGLSHHLMQGMLIVEEATP